MPFPIGPMPRPAAYLLASCPCEEHDYCDESCRCQGIARVDRELEIDPRLTVGPQIVER